MLFPKLLMHMAATPSVIARSTKTGVLSRPCRILRAAPGEQTEDAQRVEQASNIDQATRISFLLTNSLIPKSESSRPYPEFFTPPKGRSGAVQVD